MDVTHYEPFGKLKCIHFLVDTYYIGLDSSRIPCQSRSPLICIIPDSQRTTGTVLYSSAMSPFMAKILLFKTQLLKQKRENKAKETLPQENYRKKFLKFLNL